MTDKLFLRMRRRLAPALLPLLVCALPARGSDLLDAVLNAPSPAQTDKAEDISADTADSSAPAAKGRKLIDAILDTSAVSNAPVASPKANLESGQSALFPEMQPKGKLLASSDHIKNPATFSIRGGGGDAFVGSIEYQQRLGTTAFYLSVLGFVADVKAEGQFFHSENPHYVWRSGRMHKGADIVYRYWEGEQKDYGMEASLLWNPFCGRLLAPFIGLGVRYESASCEKHNSYKTFDYYYQEWHQGAWSPFRVYRDEDTSLDDSGVCLAARLGLKVNLGKMFLTGEYRVGSGFGDFDGTSELIGDIGFYLTRRMQMHVFVESVKVDLDSGTAFGGGLSFDF